MRTLVLSLVLVVSARLVSAEHLPVAADAYTTTVTGLQGRRSGPERNFGREGTILVATGSPSATGTAAVPEGPEGSPPVGYEAHGFVRFDLSALPPNAAIDKAVVRMWVGSAPLPGLLAVHLVLEPWTESAINGLTEPAVGPTIATVPIAAAGQFVFVDVTLQARDWFYGTVPNYGLALLPAGTDPLRVGLDAKENTGTGHEMELLVFGDASERFTFTGTSNTSLGVHSMISMTTGVSNTAVGAGALLANTEGKSNTAIGYQALMGNVVGNSNVAVGISALQGNVSGSFNTASGRNSMILNTTGHSNSAHGFNTLKSNTVGHANVASGVSALEFNVDGIFNTATGANALKANVSGTFNTAVGANALLANLDAANNTSVGVNSLASNTDGGDNVALGYLAGSNVATALSSNDRSVFIGAYANSSVDGLTNAIAIGSGAQASLSDVAVIGNANLLGITTTSGLYATTAPAPTLASAHTIAPTKGISFVSGTASIHTIAVPTPISSGGGQITLIPTGAWTTSTSGNIALASTAVVHKALVLTYDAGTGKWYPSY